VLVEVSLPLPLEIVATDISQSGNEGARRGGRGGGSGIKNASGRKQETRCSRSFRGDVCSYIVWRSVYPWVGAMTRNGLGTGYTLLR